MFFSFYYYNLQKDTGEKIITDVLKVDHHYFFSLPSSTVQIPFVLMEIITSQSMFIYRDSRAGSTEALTE